MHLRRALLLFAIVLGLAALAASVSRPREAPRDGAADRERRSTLTAADPAPPAIAELELSTAGRPVRRTLEAGRPGVVIVRSDRPGQVTIEGLGLTQTAQRATPARFEVLVSEPQRLEVRFTPAGTGLTRDIGTIAVKGDR